MTQRQHDLIQNIMDKVETNRRRPTGGYDRRFGSADRCGHASDTSDFLPAWVFG
jgi:hypothetical protein